MTIHKAQVVLQPADNNPENVSTNTYSFEAPPGDEVSLDRIVNGLTAFYQAVQTIFPDLVKTTGHLIKIYNQADVSPRAPVREATFGMAVGGGNSMPPEVAVCLSFQATKASGQPQARRRGRVYLGPIRASFLGTGGRPLQTLADAIVINADIVLETFNGGLAPITGAPGSARWGIASSFGQFSEVQNGWVDNEFDTQRRRGRKATVRTTFEET